VKAFELAAEIVIFKMRQKNEHEKKISIYRK